MANGRQGKYALSFAILDNAPSTIQDLLVIDREQLDGHPGVAFSEVATSHDAGGRSDHSRRTAWRWDDFF